MEFGRRFRERKNHGFATEKWPISDAPVLPQVLITAPICILKTRSRKYCFQQYNGISI